MHAPTAATQPQDSKDDINLTPMLDVVFIMLIFFIVAASFIKEVGIPVNRPDGVPRALEESSSILIVIAENNGIWMDSRLIDPRAVRANLERMRAEKPDSAVVIRADRRSMTDTLVQVMNASREAGIYDVMLAAQME